MSSWGVLARLVFVLRHVPGALQTISVSTSIMTPKAAFGERFPHYRAWLQSQVEHATERAACAPPAKTGGGKRRRAAKAPPRPLAHDAPVAKLETLLGDLLETAVGRGERLGLESFAMGLGSCGESSPPSPAAPTAAQGELDARALGLDGGTATTPAPTPRRPDPTR